MNKMVALLFALALLGCSHATVKVTSYQAFTTKVEEVPDLVESADYFNSPNENLILAAIQDARSRKLEIEFGSVIKGRQFLYYVFRLRRAEDVLIIYTTKNNRTFTHFFKYSGEVRPKL